MPGQGNVRSFIKCGITAIRCKQPALQSKDGVDTFALIAPCRLEPCYLLFQASQAGFEFYFLSSFGVSSQ